MLNKEEEAQNKFIRAALIPPMKFGLKITLLCDIADLFIKLNKMKENERNNC